MAAQRHTESQQSVTVQSDTVQPVNLDEVGNAEAVLQRLVHERKTLEGAAQTLATYRNVRAQVQGEQQKLVQIRQAVSETQTALADVAKQRDAAMRKAYEQVQQTLAHDQDIATQKLNVLQQQVTNEQEKLTVLQDEVAKFVEKYEGMIAQYKVEIDKASAELEKVKSEHAALMAQINKVAAQFTTTV